MAITKCEKSEFLKKLNILKNSSEELLKRYVPSICENMMLYPN